MLIERTNYFAKQGRADEILTVRRRASEVRVALGLPYGTIGVKRGGDGPDVSWQCGFLDRTAHEADLAARAASAEFERCRQRMRELVSRFERHVEGRDAGPNSWAGDVSLVGRAVVPREIAFPSGGLTLKGYLHLPPGPGPFPCMITNHGSGIQQGTEDICRPATAAWLASWGIASFLPHRRGYGNSPGVPWRQEVAAAYGTEDYDRQLLKRLDDESGDVIAALDAVSRLPEILADRIGVMGSSFGGTNTLLAASKSPQLRCGVEFAGAAMNWERAPRLRDSMIAAARECTQPMFYIQAENDYSIGPTRDIAKALEGSGRTYQAKIFPAHGVNNHEGHLFESTGQLLWGPEVRAFLERYL
jgi:dienelactone hydrolase